MVSNEIHQALLKNCSKVMAWLEQKRLELKFPIYTSLDIRDSGFKIASVDANIYPAGFNNICEVDREHSDTQITAYFNKNYPGVKKVLLITEEHTNNAYYWENVRALKIMLENAELEIRLAFAKEFENELEMETASGHKLKVFSAHRKNDGIILSDGFVPDLVISNNDFSLSYEEWGQNLSIKINPPRELGWYQRKKSDHFKYYNELALELSQILEIDPWLLQIDSVHFPDFDIKSEESRKKLAEQVDAMIARIQTQYDKYQIKDKPTVFVKNNAGTYGLAVTKVESGQEVLEWNYNTRKKMKAAKGGRDVDDMIIQEGIPTTVVADAQTAEPVIYMIGNELLGGFLRTHGEKGPTDSLNSPGAVYKKLCVTDLQTNMEKCRCENVYGWIGKISSLAVAKEWQALNLK